MLLVSRRIEGLERVGTYFGKAVALAESTLYAGDPGYYRIRLERISRLTPARVSNAMQRWLSRPVYALRVNPGERGPSAEAPVAAGTPAAPQAAALGEEAAGQLGGADQPNPRVVRREMPPVSIAPKLDFPVVQRARLSNGLQLIYARRSTVPVTRVRWSSMPVPRPIRRTGSARSL